VEEEKQGMVVDKGVEGNKRFPHMLMDIKVCHTLVVVGVVDCGAWCYQSICLLNETSQVYIGRMAWVLGDQEALCTSTLIENR
jgi:hypothetical protein